MCLSWDAEYRKGGVSEFNRGSLRRLKHNCTQQLNYCLFFSSNLLPLRVQVAYVAMRNEVTGLKEGLIQ